jgi:hypothetical protein
VGGCDRIRTTQALSRVLHVVSDEIAVPALAELTGTISVSMDMASVNNGPQQMKRHIKSRSDWPNLIFQKNDDM